MAYVKNITNVQRVNQETEFAKIVITATYHVQKNFVVEEREACHSGQSRIQLGSEHPRLQFVD